MLLKFKVLKTKLPFCSWHPRQEISSSSVTASANLDQSSLACRWSYSTNSRCNRCSLTEPLESVNGWGPWLALLATNDGYCPHDALSSSFAHGISILIPITIPFRANFRLAYYNLQWHTLAIPTSSQLSTCLAKGWVDLPLLRLLQEILRCIEGF